MLAYEAAEQTKLKTRQRKPSYVADKPSTPERWFNAVIPLLILTIISVIRMYFDGKILTNDEPKDTYSKPFVR